MPASTLEAWEGLPWPPDIPNAWIRACQPQGCCAGQLRRHSRSPGHTACTPRARRLHHGHGGHRYCRPPWRHRPRGSTGGSAAPCPIKHPMAASVRPSCGGGGCRRLPAVARGSADKPLLCVPLFRQGAALAAAMPARHLHPPAPSPPQPPGQAGSTGSAGEAGQGGFRKRFGSRALKPSHRGFGTQAAGLQDL